MKFRVRVYIPSYYEIEAHTSIEAGTLAVEKFKQENKDWIGPENEIFELVSETLPITYE